MATILEDLFVVGISSSALFDTKEGSRIYQEHGLEAFIEYQVKNEEKPFDAGPAMPLVKALLQTNAALTCGPRVEIIVMSHNNPAAAVRTMKSIQRHQLGIKRAAFIGDGEMERYLKPYNVSLLLSRNGDDVRAALGQGVAAALLMDGPDHVEVDDGQLRIAFDGDAVLFSDASERIYKQQGLPAFQVHELEHEKDPLPPGPFAPVLQWIAQLQRDALASGAKIRVRTAIVTARNEVAMSRVIRTMREWNVRIDETFFLGDVSKTKILHAFRPHIFFDDQIRHVLPASRLVPSGHVPYGIANEAAAVQAQQPTAIPEPSPIELQPKPLVSTSRTSGIIVSVNRKDFETKCRAIFRRYTAFSKKGGALDERYRLFIAEHAKRDGSDRSKIVNALERYNLGEFVDHDPMLNREIGDIVRKKLDAIAVEALAPKQSNLSL